MCCTLPILQVQAVFYEEAIEVTLAHIDIVLAQFEVSYEYTIEDAVS